MQTITIVGYFQNAGKVNTMILILFSDITYLKGSSYYLKGKQQGTNTSYATVYVKCT